MCSITGWTPICSGARHPTAIFIIIEATMILVYYSRFFCQDKNLFISAVRRFHWLRWPCTVNAHYLYPFEFRFYLSCSSDGLIQSVCSGLWVFNQLYKAFCIKAVQNALENEQPHQSLDYQTRQRYILMAFSKEKLYRNAILLRNIALASIIFLIFN